MRCHGRGATRTQRIAALMHWCSEMLTTRDEKYVDTGGWQCLGHPELTCCHPCRAQMTATLDNLDHTNGEELQQALNLTNEFIWQLSSPIFKPDPQHNTVWKSALISDIVEISVVFELPMTFLLRAMLMVNLANRAAQKRTVGSIPEAAQLYTEAAGVIDHMMQLIEQTKAAGHHVPPLVPDLNVQLLQDLRDLCVILAQQIAIIKATLYYEKVYSKVVLYKLHVGCYEDLRRVEQGIRKFCLDGFHTPNRLTERLLRFTDVFSRIHHAQAIEVLSQLRHSSSRFGEAIAFCSYALALFKPRESVGGVGLPALAEFGPRVHELMIIKLHKLQEQLAQWTKLNDNIYFEVVPPEDFVAETRLVSALIMRPEPYAPMNEIPQLLTNSDDLERELVASESTLGADASPITHLPKSIAATKTDHDQVPVASATASVSEVVSKETSSPRPAEALGDDEEAIKKAVARTLAARRESAHMIVPPPLLTRSRSRDSIVITPAILPVVRQNTMQTIRLDDSGMSVDEELITGKKVHRLSRDGHWKLETMKIEDEHIVFVKKNKILGFSKPRKIPIALIQAIQLERVAAQNKTSILVVARDADSISTVEIATNSNEGNDLLAQALNRYVQEQRREATAPRTSLLRSLRWQFSINSKRNGPVSWENQSEGRSKFVHTKSHAHGLGKQSAKAAR
ncbi:TPA: hypothetical protein N0F65_002099 [Lagenidium giganteum]|uniref:BRO1 domain-containing protein n=1 Tax=Lagenidium giganteum TaxID=4803 RepID=A0AAV2ZGC7_9STRA|nr:TPA: hypothetical protein N0F65_002099 [Lagenidium giganteum]